jgi:predicted phosphodiesterase
MDIIKSLQKRLGLKSGVPIQILSDAHLEVGQQYTSYSFPVSAPLLLLAGDIGRLIDYEGYLSFLQAQVARYRKVFLVLGNHEFYNLDYESGVKEARRLAAEPSIAGDLVLLHQTCWDDDESNLTILGCTLWSALPVESREIVELAVSDFKSIKDWTAEKHNDTHTAEVAWLREQVKQVAGDKAGEPRQILVATHHAPCKDGASPPEKLANLWSPAFATDLIQNDGSWDGVKVWVFGHTHYSTDFVRNGIRVVANQRGYFFPGQKVPVKRAKSKSKKDAHEFDDSKAITL